MRASTMIRVTVLTAAPAYMSLTAASTGAGAGGRTRPGRLAAGRVGLVHGDLCSGNLPKRAQFPDISYRA